MIVESKNGLYRAQLSDNTDGVTVVISRKMVKDCALGKPGLIFKPIYKTILDCPFHIALDKITEMLEDFT